MTLKNWLWVVIVVALLAIAMRHELLIWQRRGIDIRPEVQALQGDVAELYRLLRKAP